MCCANSLWPLLLLFADRPQITEQMHDLKSKLERDVKDFASLKFVMDAQAEIRDVQSWIDMKFELIIERYNTLEKYLPFGVMSKDEMDTKSVLRTQWSQILSMSSQVMSNVNGLQGGFKQDLMDNVKIFKADVKRFRADYDLNGPMARSADASASASDPAGKSIPPLEAMTRLNKYKREFETLNRKFELFNGGEKLFGLPEQKYPDLVKTSVAPPAPPRSHTPRTCACTHFFLSFFLRCGGMRRGASVSAGPRLTCASFFLSGRLA